MSHIKSTKSAVLDTESKSDWFGDGEEKRLNLFLESHRAPLSFQLIQLDWFLHNFAFDKNIRKLSF